MATDIDRVRSFNRLVTERLGVLRPGFLGGDRPYGPSRLLWEIGAGNGDIGALRSRLGLDSGYASRLLRSLEREGLITVEPNPADRRRRVAGLTAAGRAEHRLLDKRSDTHAESFLAPLTDTQRASLVAAMGDVERLLTAAAVEIRTTEPGHPDARRCVAAYFAELDERSELGVDPEAASIPVDPETLRAPRGAQLVAYLHDEAIGCGSVKHRPGEPSEIKRLWVSPAARGLGVGRRLLDRLETLAGESGAPAVQLDTNCTLTEAIAMYRATGYEEVAPFNDEAFAHHWFQKPLG